MTEDERRRYENSHLGDSLDDKIEYFSSISCDSFVIGGQQNEEHAYDCQWLDGNRVEIEGGLLAR